jgi:hypothetical protein
VDIHNGVQVTNPAQDSKLSKTELRLQGGGASIKMARPGGQALSLQQQHLARALNRAVELTLVMCREASVLPGKNPPLVRDKLLEQVDVLEIQGVYCEVNLRLGTRGSGFHSSCPTTSLAAAAWFFKVRFAWHKVKLVT